MAGTLFGLGLSQQFDVNGDPLSGALLYIYVADSSTPVDIYRNVGLTLLHPWPLVADSTGRIPAFWLEDGSYRARLTSAEGVEQFNEPNMLALGPSSGGGGGGDTTDADATLTTGDVKWRPTTGDLPGWVRMHGGTLGNNFSGATYIGPDATHQGLFEYIWNTLTEPTNTFLPVLPARGANAAADWGANRKITLLDMRGRSPFGLDDMGASAAGRLTGLTFGTLGSAITAGSNGGASTHTLLLTQTPSHDHGFVSAGGHSHTLIADATGGAHDLVSGTESIMRGRNSGAFSDYVLRGDATPLPTLGISSIVANHNHSFASAGGGLAHPTISPFLLGTWYWRL